MADPGPHRSDDPYVVRPAEPHPDAGNGRRPAQRPDRDRRPPDPDALRRARTLLFLSAIAAVSAVALAPLGLALGIVTLVLAYVRREDIRRARLGSLATAVPVAGGIFAIVVGGIFSLALVLFGSEMNQYRQCISGANTRMAEQRCQDELFDGLEDRLR